MSFGLSVACSACVTGVATRTVGPAVVELRRRIVIVLVTIIRGCVGKESLYLSREWVSGCWTCECLSDSGDESIWVNAWGLCRCIGCGSISVLACCRLVTETSVVIGVEMGSHVR